MVIYIIRWLQTSAYNDRDTKCEKKYHPSVVGLDLFTVLLHSRLSVCVKFLLCCASYQKLDCKKIESKCKIIIIPKILSTGVLKFRYVHIFKDVLKLLSATTWFVEALRAVTVMEEIRHSKEIGGLLTSTAFDNRCNAVILDHHLHKWLICTRP